MPLNFKKYGVFSKSHLYGNSENLKFYILKLAINILLLAFILLILGFKIIGFIIYSTPINKNTTISSYHKSSKNCQSMMTK